MLGLSGSHFEPLSATPYLLSRSKRPRRWAGCCSCGWLATKDRPDSGIHSLNPVWFHAWIFRRFGLLCRTKRHSHEFAQPKRYGNPCFPYVDLLYRDLIVSPYQIYAAKDAAIRQRRGEILDMGNRVPIGNGDFILFSMVPGGSPVVIALGNYVERRGLRTTGRVYHAQS